MKGEKREGWDREKRKEKRDGTGRKRRRGE